MLGEVIAESAGKRIVRRVLDTEPLTVEVSFEDAGHMLGIGTNGLGTYTSVAGPDGSLYGEGQGANFSAEGDFISWKGSGQGKIGADGSISYRGILYFRTASQKMARLNGSQGVFEYEVDPEGKTHSKVWEWK